MKDLMPTGQVETYEALVTPSLTMPCGLENPPSVERESGGGQSMSDSNLLIEPLPPGWNNHHFGELCDRVKDSYQPIDGGDTPYVGLEHLAQGFPAFVGRGKESEVKSSKTAFKIGDILFGKLRPYLRKGAQADFDGVCSTDILAFRAKLICASEFLKFVIHSDEFISHAKSTTSGVQHPRTSWPSLREFRLSLPPLSEQKKIAHILSTVQRAIEAQERIIQATTELKKALMHKLFTEGLRKEPQKESEIGLVPESWEVVKIGDVTEVKGGKRLPKNDKIVEHNTGFPYIRVTDFNEFSVDMCGIRFLTKTAQKQIFRYIINQTDVFISIAGSIGITGMIPPELDGANLTENAARLIVNDSSMLQPRFLMYWLASHHCQAEIKAQTVKNAQPKLALARIKSLNAPLPSLEEQVEIATAMDLAKRKTDNARSKRDLLKDLFRILLHELMTAKTRVNQIKLPAA